MQTLLYYLTGFLIVGAAGMWLGSRKTNVTVRRQRWLKYGIYVLITILLLAAIYTGYFQWLILFIIAAGAVELFLAGRLMAARGINMMFLAFGIYGVIAAGAWLFAGEMIPAVLLFFYCQVFIFDAFCQVSGQLFGRHLLAPAISPGKTIEGFVGGWLFCILTAVLCAGLVDVALLTAALYGLLTGFIAFCGDMLASYYKRKLRIKDYSNWLPGQGGFLDRFDSLLMTMAVYYFLYAAGLKMP